MINREKFEKFTIGFIGFGAMGKALFQAFTDSKKSNSFIERKEILCYDLHKPSMLEMKKRKISSAQSALDCFLQCKYVFFCIKPQQVRGFFQEFKQAIGKEFKAPKYSKKPVSTKELLSMIFKNKLFISILAGVNIASLQQELSHAFLEGLETPSTEFPKFKAELPVARVMPNIAALCGKSSGAFSYTRAVSANKVLYLKKVLAGVGYFEEVDEKYMHAITAICGSAPAIFFQCMHAMAQEALSMGLPYQKALALIAYSMEGSAHLLAKQDELKTAAHSLISKVCSPAGTSIAALKALEKNSFNATVMDALQKAAARSEELEKLGETDT